MVRLVNVSVSLGISKFDRLINRPQFQVITFLLLNIENSNIAIHTIFVTDKKIVRCGIKLQLMFIGLTKLAFGIFFKF